MAPEIKGMMEPYFKTFDHVKTKGIIEKAGATFGKAGTITNPSRRSSKVCIPFVLGKCKYKGCTMPHVYPSEMEATYPAELCKQVKSGVSFYVNRTKFTEGPPSKKHKQNE